MLGAAPRTSTRESNVGDADVMSEKPLAEMSWHSTSQNCDLSGGLLPSYGAINWLLAKDVRFDARRSAAVRYAGVSVTFVPVSVWPERGSTATGTIIGSQVWPL